MTRPAYRIENLETGAVAVHREFDEALAICRAAASSLARCLGLRLIEAFDEADMVIFGCPGRGGDPIALFRLSAL